MKARTHIERTAAQAWRGERPLGEVEAATGNPTIDLLLPISGPRPRSAVWQRTFCQTRHGDESKVEENSQTWKNGC
jgi:hypothetical protein